MDVRFHLDARSSSVLENRKRGSLREMGEVFIPLFPQKTTADHEPGLEWHVSALAAELRYKSLCNSACSVVQQAELDALSCNSWETNEFYTWLPFRFSSILVHCGAIAAPRSAVFCLALLQALCVMPVNSIGRWWRNPAQLYVVEAQAFALTPFFFVAAEKMRASRKLAQSRREQGVF
ncbi:hypothetical protein BKA80DRAFT_17334 [Phyllosticta citrichinensis]